MNSDTVQLVVPQDLYATRGMAYGFIPCSGPIPLRPVLHSAYSHAGETTCRSCEQKVMVYRLRTPIMHEVPVVKQPLSRRSMRAGLVAYLGSMTLLVAGLPAYAASSFTFGFMMFMYTVLCYFMDNRRMPPVAQTYLAEPVAPGGPYCRHGVTAHGGHP